jgi:hypothetical protein
MHAPNLKPNKTKSDVFFSATVLLCRGCSHRATQAYGTQSQADIWKLEPNKPQQTASSMPVVTARLADWCNVCTSAAY